MLILAMQTQGTTTLILFSAILALELQLTSMTTHMVCVVSLALQSLPAIFTLVVVAFIRFPCSMTFHMRLKFQMAVKFFIAGGTVLRVGFMSFLVAVV